ncbi:hypothetical protein ATKI12_3009 [Kitasatospora sp. Ki12]
MGGAVSAHGCRPRTRGHPFTRSAVGTIAQADAPGAESAASSGRWGPAGEFTPASDHLTKDDTQ